MGPCTNYGDYNNRFLVGLERQPREKIIYISFIVLVKVPARNTMQRSGTTSKPARTRPTFDLFHDVAQIIVNARIPVQSLEPGTLIRSIAYFGVSSCCEASF